MNKITFEGYKNAIKSQYETIKIEGIHGSGDLSNITPAKLRDLCLRISEMGLSKEDESTFRFFFNAKEEEKLGRVIDNFGTGKLKSVISFLKGDKNSENPNRIELASIIIDFNPRPFNKYKQNCVSNNSINDFGLNLNKQSINNSNGFVLKELTDNVPIPDVKYVFKKIFLYLFFLAFLFFGICSMKYLFFPAKECMQWNKNHYDAVCCSNQKLGIGQLNLVVPMDNQIMKLVRLNSKVALQFFDNDKPIIWYSKEDGKIELFNQPGFHPETAKPLKPITNYIIEKYQLKSK